MRIALVIFVLAACVAGVATLFWQQDLKYVLPTPVPVNYRGVAIGQPVNLPSFFNERQAYFLHFYNPDCPCSRFNARHIKSIVRSYSDSLKIIIIVPTIDDIKSARQAFGDALEIQVNTNEVISKACGVYSTPQAAIIDREGKLYYRGNYNKSRYCTTRASNFAELSLVALLNHQPSPSFGLLATQSYGCEIDADNDAEANLLSF